MTTPLRRRTPPRLIGSLAVALAVAGCASTSTPTEKPERLAEVNVFNVRRFGVARDAAGAINRAIYAANAAGGGTVVVPAGRYVCTTIRLLSNVEVRLERGCTIVAADGGFDLAESNPWRQYQDYGHSHWHNSLFVGDGVENVAITGAGLIDGTAMSDGYTQRVYPESTQPTSRPAATRPVGGSATPTSAPTTGPTTRRNTSDALRPGVANKAIALVNCRNVTLRDVSILRAGHFGLLATGVDTLTIDNVKIDTNRDGMDIDACRNVRVSNCTINSPNDDAICLKSSFGLGFARSTDDVTISNNYVTGGYHIGTVLTGDWQRFRGDEPGGRTGRIKMGTESNGGFKRIAISNCVLDASGGVFIESEDGAIVEDIAVSNLVMHDVSDSAIFIRLGARLRGPNNPPVGAIRRVNIDNVVATNVNWRYGTILSGVPGHPIEDVSISNVRILTQGGGTEADAALDPPEREAAYPDPGMFGTLPAYGLFARHVRNLSVSNAQITSATPDARPWAALWDVDGAEFLHVRGSPAVANASVFNFRDVANLHVHDSLLLADVYLAKVIDGNEVQPTSQPATP